MARVSSPPIEEKRLRELALSHGPTNWESEISVARLDTAVNKGESINAIVMAADIRSSTVLMREAIDSRAFADILTEFVDAARTQLRTSRGWFDKFTGDGFLAYWIYDERPPQAYTREIADFCNLTLQFFGKTVANDLRKIVRNFPRRAGLSIGVDAGAISIVPVSGDLTIVSPVVVGAVRMVSVAAPYETVVNGYLGAPLYRDYRDGLLGFPGSVHRAIRPTKEFPDGQEVYRVRFAKTLSFSSSSGV